MWVIVTSVAKLHEYVEPLKTNIVIIYLVKRTAIYYTLSTTLGKGHTLLWSISSMPLATRLPLKQPFPAFNYCVPATLKV